MVSARPELAPCTAEQKCDEDADECVTPTESLIIITPENPGVGESTSFSPQTSAKGSNCFLLLGTQYRKIQLRRIVLQPVRITG